MATQSVSSKRNGLIARLRLYWKENEWAYLIVGIVIGILIPYVFQSIQADAFNEFLTSLVPEAACISFTVLIIDRLDAIREEQVIKDQLVRRLQNFNHHFDR